MRNHKIVKILLVALTMVCMVLPSAEARKKNNGGKSKGSRSEHSFMINAGGGFGLIIPGFDIYSEEWGSEWNPDYNAWTYINFGGYLVGNFGITFDMGKKKKWSLGPAVQLGWKAEGGPFAGYTEKRGSNMTTWTPDQIYGDADWFISERGRFMHAFIADLCVAIKGNPAKSARLVAEGGLRFSVAAMYDYVAWRAETPTTVYKYTEGWSAATWKFMLGPSLFIGGDAYVSDNVMITPGLRFAAAFGPDWRIGGVSVHNEYDRFGNPIPVANVQTYRYRYNHTYIDIAFEMKINWYSKQ